MGLWLPMALDAPLYIKHAAVWVRWSGGGQTVLGGSLFSTAVFRSLNQMVVVVWNHGECIASQMTSGGRDREVAYLA